MKQISNEDKDILVENVINDAIYAIQMNLGVSDGFDASIFFSGNDFDTMKSIFKDYIDYQIKMGD